MLSGIELAQKFLSGAIPVFEGPIDNSKAFAALSDTYSEKNTSIKAAVMEYSHGACHDLTIGLADALSQETVIVIVDPSGMPVHSGLFFNGSPQLMLDANGVHTLEASVSFWSRLSGQQCSARQMETEWLCAFYGCDDLSAKIALEEFSYIAEFMQAKFIQADLTPKSIPDAAQVQSQQLIDVLSDALSHAGRGAPSSQKLPIRKVSALWHWGSLDVTQKFERGISYEGNLFSMSACPDAWSQIGRFGGKPLHMKSDSSTLLDMYSILHAYTQTTKSLLQEISDWGVAQGLLEQKSIFMVSWYDDELEDQVSMKFNSRAEAEAEVSEDVEGGITETHILACTPELLSRHGFKNAEIVGVEYAIIDWAQAHCSEVLDGVYWDETYDPDRYSAPRAGMFPFELSRLTAVDEFPGDDEALQGVSRIKGIEFPEIRRLEVEQKSPSL